MTDTAIQRRRLILPFNGVDGGTSTDDFSWSQAPMTFVGNAQIDTGITRFAEPTLLLDGSGDWLTTPRANVLNEKWDAFTIEGWFRLTNRAANPTLFSTRTTGNNGIAVNITPTGDMTMTAFVSGGVAAQIITSVGNLMSDNVWAHFALVKNGTLMEVFIDGVSVGTDSLSSSTSIGNGTNFEIGRQDRPADNLFMAGNVGPFRISDEAVYTSNFTPPSSAYPSDSTDPFFSDVSLLLNMDGANGSTAFTDLSPLASTVTASGNAQVSTAQSVFGGASCRLDGTGDFLTIPHTPALTADQDFVIECWVRLASIPTGIATIASKRKGGGAETSDYTLSVDSSGFGGAFTLWASGTSGTPVSRVTSTTIPVVDTWYHVSAVRKSSQWQLFINGILEATDAESAAIQTLDGDLLIGRDPSNTGRDFDGWLDDFRITRGVTRRAPTENFPLSPIPLGPSLWLDAADASTIDDTAGVIDQWRDKSFNNHTFSQSTTAARPLIDTQTLNGLPVVDFDGVDDRLVCDQAASEFAYLNDDGPVTTYFVVKPFNAKNPEVFAGIVATGTGSSGQRGYTISYDDRTNPLGNQEVIITHVSTGNNPSSAPVVSTTTNGRIPANEWSIFGTFTDTNAAQADRCFTYSNGELIPERNNVSTTATTSGTPLGTLVIGDVAGSGFHLEGQIAEILIFPRQLTGPERLDLEGYLATKWGLEYRFDVDHPGITTSAQGQFRDNPIHDFILNAEGFEGESEFRDSSGNGNAVNQVGGGGIVVDHAQSLTNYRTPSIRFNGGDYLEVPSLANLNLNSDVPSAGKFTIDCFFRTPNVTTQGIVYDGRTNNLDGQNITLFYANASLNVYVNGSTRISATISANTTYHVRVVHNGVSSLRLFVNGTYAGQYTSAVDYVIGANGLRIGASGGPLGNDPLPNGAYVDNVCIALGDLKNNFTNSVDATDRRASNVARVMSYVRGDALGPNNTPIDEMPGVVWSNLQGTLALESNGKFDSSLRWAALSNYGFVTGAFAGPSSLGTEDFTIQGWVQGGDNNAADRAIFEMRAASSTTDRINAFCRPNQERLTVNHGSVLLESTDTVRGSSAYVHFAVVRKTGATHMWIDGVLQAPTVDNRDNFTAMDYHLGTLKASPTGNTWAGTVDDFSILRNQALYDFEDGNFTPPTTPFIDDTPALPLVIDTQPSPVTVTEPAPAVFTVAASGGTGVLTYQWFENAAPMSGEVADTLTIDPTAVAQSGNTYYVVVSDDFVSVQSNTVTLTVNATAPPPLGSFDPDLPATLTVTEGDPVNLTVAVANATAYQWFSNAVAIPGETNASYSFTSVLGDNGNTYFAEATNGVDTITSTTLTLTVEEVVVDPPPPPPPPPQTGKLIDLTEPGTPNTFEPKNTVIAQKQDWAGIVAAAEGGTKRVSDYIFSNRVFTRIDKLLNPKDD